LEQFKNFKKFNDHFWPDQIGFRVPVSHIIGLISNLFAQLKREKPFSEKPFSVHFYSVKKSRKPGSVVSFTHLPVFFNFFISNKKF